MHDRHVENIFSKRQSNKWRKRARSAWEIYTCIYRYRYIGINIYIRLSIKAVLRSRSAEYRSNWRIKSGPINLHVILSFVLTNARCKARERHDILRRKYSLHVHSLRRYPVIIENRRRSCVMQIIRSNRPHIRFSRCMNVPWISIRAPGRYGGCNVTSLVTVRTLRTDT